MKKALVLAVGAAIYLWFIHAGQLVASREMTHIQNLYTAADAATADISPSAR